MATMIGLNYGGCLGLLILQALTLECGAVISAEYEGVKWIDPTHAQTLLPVGGKAFNDSVTASRYNRLPASAQSHIRSAVWGLSTMPAGQFLQFKTDASSIYVNYTLVSSALAMWHFPATGVAGVDLYGWDDDNKTWRWTGTSDPIFPVTVSQLLKASCPSNKCPVRSYRLHLPPYAAIKGSSLYIGVNTETTVFENDRSYFGTQKPIIWYGTSILQGAVASRPGQMHTHITSRGLATEIYNFGFSGNGVMEINVSQYFTAIDASLIIIDCNPNMNFDTITERTVPLVQYLRSNGHASTPIVLSEGTQYGNDCLLGNNSNNAIKNKALSTQYNKLIASGVKNLHYAKTKDITAPAIVAESVSSSFVDATVGGTHLTDLGMRKQASFWIKYIQELQELYKNESNSRSTTVTINSEVPDSNVRFPEATNISVDRFGRSDFMLQNTHVLGRTSSKQLDVDVNSFIGGRILPNGERNNTFDRIPIKYAESLGSSIWQLSQMSTGLYLRFTTNASEVHVSWTLRPVCGEEWEYGCHLSNMPDSGTNAMDLFVFQPSTAMWRHYPTDLLHYSETGTAPFIKPPVIAEDNVTYILYLPLRNAPENISMAVSPSNAVIVPASDPADGAPKFKSQPILWYGTSSQQGGVASRAGNTYDAIIARTISHEIVNLGFAYNGQMDTAVAQLINDVASASAIVIDCVHDMTVDEITGKTAAFVQTLRRGAHSETPIILVEGIPDPANWINTSIQGASPDPRNTALKQQWSSLQAAGVVDVFYVTCDELLMRKLGDSGPEGIGVNPTVYGVEPSDLGQYEIAAFFVNYFKSIFSKKSIGATTESETN